MTELFVVIATAVYDQGVVGVYADEQSAVEAAKRIWPQTDGHHAFRIERLELGRTYENVFTYASKYDFLHNRLTTEPPDIARWTKQDAKSPPMYNLLDPNYSDPTPSPEEHHGDS